MRILKKILYGIGIIAFVLYAGYYISGFWGMTCTKNEREAMYEIKHYKHLWIRSFGGPLGGCFAEYSVDEKEKTAVIDWYKKQLVEHGYTPSNSKSDFPNHKGNLNFMLVFDPKVHRLSIFISDEKSGWHF